jgi:hypothetical protein
MLKAILRNAGFNPRNFPAVLRGWFRYRAERRRFRELLKASESGLAWGREFPVLCESGEDSGHVGQYFFQDKLVAGWILDRRPESHFDVGSRIDGFIGSLSLFCKVHVFDIRHSPPAISNVEFHRMDITEPLREQWRSCAASLSCLHSLEHFGLGRYGDKLDPDGHLKGLANLMEMVSAGGLFYLSVPIGEERVEFNAHRIFHIETVEGWFRGGWTIERHALVGESSVVLESHGKPEPQNHGGFGGLLVIEARKQALPTGGAGGEGS